VIAEISVHQEPVGAMNFTSRVDITGPASLPSFFSAWLMVRWLICAATLNRSHRSKSWGQSPRENPTARASETKDCLHSTTPSVRQINCGATSVLAGKKHNLRTTATRSAISRTNRGKRRRNHGPILCVTTKHSGVMAQAKVCCSS
jgi:hypothetical protein